jgi:hypothetical protein
VSSSSSKVTIRSSQVSRDPSESSITEEEYDLRHTGDTLATRSGATLKDTMVRAGQSSEKAALIYQHFDDVRQQEVAAGLDATVRRARQEAAVVPDDPLDEPADQRSGTNLARGE